MFDLERVGLAVTLSIRNEAVNYLELFCKWRLWLYQRSRSQTSPFYMIQAMNMEIIRLISLQGLCSGAPADLGTSTHTRKSMVRNQLGVAPGLH